MQYPVEQGQYGQRSYRPQSNPIYTPVQDKNYDRPSPQQRAYGNDTWRPEDDYQTQNFRKNSGSRKSIKEQMNRELPPKYFQIKPYIENILYDQVTQNKEVQRNLQDLKYLNEKLLSDLGESGYERQQQTVKGTQWQQIQRLIDQIIHNSQNQTSEFKASLQHLKNIKNKTLQQDLNYYEQDQGQLSNSYYKPKEEKRQIQAHHLKHSNRGTGRPFSQNFHPKTENERRLLDEIIGLRQQNKQLKVRIRREVDKNRNLTKRLHDVEYNHSHIRERRVDDRSQTQYRDDDLKEHLYNLNQRVRNSNTQNQNLRKELKDLRPLQSNYRDSKRNLKNQVRDIQSYTLSSERRARNFQSIQHSQQAIIDELNRLKYQNNQLRNDTVELLKTKSQPRYKNYGEVDDYRMKKLQTSLANYRTDNPNSYRKDESSYRYSSKYY